MRRHKRSNHGRTQRRSDGKHARQLCEWLRNIKRARIAAHRPAGKYARGRVNKKKTCKRRVGEHEAISLDFIQRHTPTMTPVTAAAPWQYLVPLLSTAGERKRRRLALGGCVVKFIQNSTENIWSTPGICRPPPPGLIAASADDARWLYPFDREQ